MSFEAIAIFFAVLVWVISGIVRFFKWIGTQARGTNARPNLVQQAVADAQRQAAASRPPGPVAPAGFRPAQTSALPQPPASALPPPVRYKTSTVEFVSQEFVSQEQALRAEEVSGLGVPLGSAPPPRPAQTAPLFGTTDDLVRAIILQEVLGPPLSRRQNSPPPPPA